MDAAFQKMLYKYGLNVNTAEAQNLDIATLWSSLGLQLHPADKAICDAFAAKANESFSSDNENSSDSKENHLTQNVMDFRREDEEQKGRKEADYLFNKYRDQFWFPLLEDKDYIEEIEQQQRAERKRKRRTIYLIISLAAVLIGIIVIYNLPYFAESRAYNRVEKAFKERILLDYEVGQYFANFPDGRHKEDVLILQMNGCWDAKDLVQCIDAASQYMKEFPNGRETARAKEIYNSVWDTEISEYKKSVKSNSNKEASDYIISMLTYMKEHNVRVVNVKTEHEIDVKDYEDYPANARRLLEENYNSEGFHLPEDAKSIKAGLFNNTSFDWGFNVSNSLQESFDNIFAPGFITFVNADNRDEVDLNKDAPYINVTAIMSNDEDRFAGNIIPVIWVFKQRIGSIDVKSTGGLYLGLSIKFNVDCGMPDSNATYHFSTTTTTGEDQISNTDTDEIYNKMLNRCFNNFTEQLTAILGM